MPCEGVAKWRSLNKHWINSVHWINFHCSQCGWKYARCYRQLVFAVFTAVTGTWKATLDLSQCDTLLNLPFSLSDQWLVHLPKQHFITKNKERSWVTTVVDTAQNMRLSLCDLTEPGSCTQTASGSGSERTKANGPLVCFHTWLSLILFHICFFFFFSYSAAGWVMTQNIQIKTPSSSP